MQYIKDEVSFNGIYSPTIFKTIFSSIYGYKLKFIIFLVIGFIGRSCLLINANIIGKWADNLCQRFNICNSNINFFSHLNDDEFIKILLFFSIFGLFFSVAFRIVVSRIGTYAAGVIYDETTLRVSRFPMTFFDTNPIGRIISRFSSDYSAIARMSGGPVTEILTILFDLILYFIFVMLASIYFVPIMIVTIYFNYILYSLSKNKIRKERREICVRRSNVLSHFSETLYGTRIIRIFGKDNSFIKKFNSKIEQYIIQKNKTNFLINLFSFKLAILNILILFFTSILGIYLVINKYVTVGSLGVAITFILMISTTVQVFFEWVAVLEEALTGIERLDNFLHKEIECGSFLPVVSKFNTNHKHVNIDQEREIRSLRFYDNKNASLSVENLSLKYIENGNFILKNVDFRVSNGEKIGIIGKTGSGKSTILQAIYHLYPLSEGSVKINDFEADIGQKKIFNHKYISLEMFRSAISFIAQEPTIFSGSLRENFTINKNISDDEIIFVANNIGLGKLLSKGKKSLDLEIRERGFNLSLGEKQLICMVRCLLQNSPIILMDEPTSSIDPFTEELLVNAIKKFLQDKTQIIVAHRLSTIQNCDRIIWFDSGKIKMDGKSSTVLNAFKTFNETKLT